jgi:hypothetical protein
MDKVNEVVGGFNIPLVIRQRKEKLDEVLKLNKDLNEGHALLFVNKMDEDTAKKVAAHLDEGKFDVVAEQIRERVLREFVRATLREVVRKKKGGAGFVLFSPNQGKKKAPKAAGSFPTKLGAKKAELARFPPKDPGKLQRLRKEVERLLKDPKKRAETEKKAKDDVKKESKELVEAAIISHEILDSLLVSRPKVMRESLFKEAAPGSDWDQYIARMPDKVLSADKRFQTVQKNIAKISKGATAGKPEKVVQEGKTSYEIIIEKKGEKIEYTISPAGKVTDKEEIEEKGEKKEGDKKD